MAELMDDAEFWLPAKFLTDDEVTMKEDNLKNGKNDTELMVSSHSFPTEFPYEFDSFDCSVLSSPVDSVVGSTETESSEEDDEFLAGLTRRLAYSTSQKLTVPIPHTFSLDKNEKNGALANSPRSTLSGVGCWSSSTNGSPNGPSQVPSPPTTPFCAQNDTWDLIYAAAGQVARLKMSNDVPKYTNFSHGRDLSKAQNHFFMKNSCNNSLYTDQTHPFSHAQTNQVIGRQLKASNWQAQLQQQQQQQHQQFQSRTWNNVVGGRSMGLSQSSWPSLQSQQKQPQNHSGSGMKAMFLGSGSGGGIKRESAGTGVFIPRRYNNPEPRKKSGCSTVLVPANVVQALNLNFDDANSHVQPQFNPSFASNYDAMVARRNAVLLTQARRNYRQDGGLNLPQEWTY